jgi:O-antigen/teichoic acid export membrane protein
MLGQILVLSIILILTKTTSGSLFHLALALGFSPIIIMFVSSFWFYSHEYKKYKPSIRLFERNIVRDIFSLGSKFFFIQIAAIVIYQTTNVIIAQVSSPQNVTIYNIVYKYFSIIIIVFNIILAPLWNAYTEAYVKSDFEWISKTIHRMILLWVLFVIGTIIMLIISPWIYSFWISNEIAFSIPYSISVICAIYVSIFNWGAIYATFVNGVGKIQLQLYFSVISSVLYIPLAIILNKYLNINGIIVAMCVVVLVPGILLSIQYKKIITQKSSVFWNK